MADENSFSSRSSEEPHRGWYDRGYLPHYDSAHAIQFITWRLADSVPRPLMDKLEQELASLSIPETRLESERRKKIEAILDRGYGDCLLRRKACAAAVRDTLLSGNGQSYHLHAWVIMPNHVHLLAQFLAGNEMGTVIQTWKGSTAHRIGELANRTGEIWQEDFWDRYMRDEEHYRDTLRYIALNPVRAGLVKSPAKWEWWWSARR